MKLAVLDFKCIYLLISRFYYYLILFFHLTRLLIGHADTALELYLCRMERIGSGHWVLCRKILLSTPPPLTSYVLRRVIVCMKRLLGRPFQIVDLQGLLCGHRKHELLINLPIKDFCFSRTKSLLGEFFSMIEGFMEDLKVERQKLRRHSGRYEYLQTSEVRLGYLQWWPTIE